jgi:hypothetical protein
MYWNFIAIDGVIKNQLHIYPFVGVCKQWTNLFKFSNDVAHVESIFPKRIYLILPAALGPGVYSASNRNEYQKHKNNNVSGE